MKEANLSQSNKYIARNPYTGEHIATFDTWTHAQIESALHVSKQAFDTWKLSNTEHRILFLSRLSEYLKVHVDDLSKIITDEMGKPLAQSKAEVLKSARLCDYYAEQLPAIEKTRTIPLDGDTYAFVHYLPQGAVLGVMPWNFPVWQVIRFAVPVLSGGNVVLLKHAQNVPLTALAIEKAVSYAAQMDGLLITVFCSHDDTEKLIAHNHVCGVSLTGSEKAGMIVGQTAGRHIKKTVMELGGSDAYIVLSDADIDKAAKQAVRGRLNNNGQTCIAAKRFIIHASVYDEFVHSFQNHLQNLKVGSPYEADTDVSGMARTDLAESLAEQVSKSTRAGAVSLLNGGIISDNPTVFYPDILENIPMHSPAYQEELFGPVASMFKVSDEKQAVSLANDTPYGLGATVWSQDLDRALNMSQSLTVGSVSINKMLSSDPRVPFGGTKKSGFGREMSDEGYYEFLNTQSVIIAHE